MNRKQVYRLYNHDNTSSWLLPPSLYGTKHRLMCLHVYGGWIVTDNNSRVLN